MGQTAASQASSVDADVERGIRGLLGDPQAYLKRREAEELQDIQDEVRQRRAVLSAERERHSTLGDKFVGFVRRAPR
jgi:hypothetical protein